MPSTPEQSQHLPSDTVLKMNFWLIPYLVAYNVSDSSDWKYGPEHTFRVEISSNVTFSIRSAHAYVDTNMDIACRPIKLGLIQCRIDSAVLDKYILVAGSSVKSVDALSRYHNGQYEIGSVFQVEFNEEGISKVWFLKSNEKLVYTFILAMIGTMNPGISLAGRKFDNFDAREKSMIGTCDASFEISRKYSTEKQDRDVTMIEGYNLNVPSLGATSDNATIVIKKKRRMERCTRQKPYTFLSIATDEDDPDKMLSVITITHSHSELYFGSKSFGGYTENLGALIYLGSTSNMRTLQLGERIRVSLKSIRPAKEELRNIGDLANVGAGFQPGIEWP